MAKPVAIRKGLFTWIKGHIFTGGAEVFGFEKPFPYPPIMLTGTGYEYAQKWNPYQPPQVYANLMAPTNGLGGLVTGSISQAPLNQNQPTQES